MRLWIAALIFVFFLRGHRDLFRFALRSAEKHNRKVTYHTVRILGVLYVLFVPVAAVLLTASMYGRLEVACRNIIFFMTLGIVPYGYAREFLTRTKEQNRPTLHRFAIATMVLWSLWAGFLFVTLLTIGA